MILKNKFEVFDTNCTCVLNNEIIAKQINTE